MTNWQKVRVEFDDADGNRVLAAMWAESIPGGFRTEGGVFTKNIGPSLWIEWSSDFDGITVTPIRELPTGLGAVIEVPTVPGDCERWVRTAEDNWVNDWRTEKPDSYFDVLNFTVLSEGVPFD